MNSVCLDDPHDRQFIDAPPAGSNSNVRIRPPGRLSNFDHFQKFGLGGIGRRFFVFGRISEGRDGR